MKLHFRRINQEQSPGVVTVEYEAVARKNAFCAEYQIRDTVIFPPADPQMKPILVVEPNGVRVCR